MEYDENNPKVSKHGEKAFAQDEQIFKDNSFFKIATHRPTRNMNKEAVHVIRIEAKPPYKVVFEVRSIPPFLTKEGSTPREDFQGLLVALQKANKTLIICLLS